MIEENENFMEENENNEWERDDYEEYLKWIEEEITPKDLYINSELLLLTYLESKECEMSKEKVCTAVKEKILKIKNDEDLIKEIIVVFEQKAWKKSWKNAEKKELIIHKHYHVMVYLKEKIKIKLKKDLHLKINEKIVKGYYQGIKKKEDKERVYNYITKEDKYPYEYKNIKDLVPKIDIFKKLLIEDYIKEIMPEEQERLDLEHKYKKPLERYIKIFESHLEYIKKTKEIKYLSKEQLEEHSKILESKLLESKTFHLQEIAIVLKIKAKKKVIENYLLEKADYCEEVYVPKSIMDKLIVSISEILLKGKSANLKEIKKQLIFFYKLNGKRKELELKLPEILFNKNVTYNYLKSKKVDPVDITIVKESEIAYETLLKNERPSVIDSTFVSNLVLIKQNENIKNTRLEMFENNLKLKEKISMVINEDEVIYANKKDLPENSELITTEGYVLVQEIPYKDKSLYIKINEYSLYWIYHICNTINKLKEPLI